MNRFHRALFIVNPAAGALPSRRRLDAAIGTVCAEFGIQADVVLTAAPGHATELAARAEADVIVACGGDGTLNEIINGVRSPAVRVGQIPGGTANVWAKEAGIPHDPAEALRAQLSGPSLPLDVGRIGARRFLLMASYGLDAAAVAAVRPGLKRRLGPLAYIISGFQVGVRYPGFEVTLQFDDGPPQHVEATMMLFANTRLYGGLAPIAREASAVDGLLDCVVFLGHGPALTLRMIPMVVWGRHLQSERVLYRRARRIRIAPLQGGALPPLQVDGDATEMQSPRGGAPPASEPVMMTVDHHAVTLFVPCPERPLFQT